MKMEMILDGGGVFLTPQLSNNITISTASANTLAHALQSVLQQSPVSTFLLPAIAFLSLITAVATSLVAYSTYKMSKNTFVNNILKQFFDISISLPMQSGGKLSDHHKQLICNFFEFVCHLIENGQLKQKDIKPLTNAMNQKLFVDFMKEYRIGKGKKELLDAYWRWHQKNK